MKRLLKTRKFEFAVLSKRKNVVVSIRRLNVFYRLLILHLNNSGDFYQVVHSSSVEILM